MNDLDVAPLQEDFRERRLVKQWEAAMKTRPWKTEVVGYDGPPCPRCGNYTEVREHKRIGQKQLRRPYYFSRWYCCTNGRCKTTLIMPEEFKVFNAQALKVGDDVVMDVLGTPRNLSSNELIAAVERDVREIATDKVFNTPESVWDEVLRRLAWHRETGRL
jgi:ribosomal protein S27AE